MGRVKLAGREGWGIAVAIGVLAASAIGFISPGFAQVAARPDVIAVAVVPSGVSAAGPSAPGRRFVIELTAPVEFRVFPLADPDQIVIDLPEVEWRLPARAAIAGVGAAGPVRNLRYGLFQPGLSRVVLDLAMPMLVDRAELDAQGQGGPWRIAIDFTPATRAQFEAAAHAGQADRLAVQAAAAATPAIRPAPRRDLPVIAVDPGHGGVHRGHVGLGPI